MPFDIMRVTNCNGLLMIMVLCANELLLNLFHEIVSNLIKYNGEYIFLSMIM
jgi:hypothetical protein